MQTVDVIVGGQYGSEAKGHVTAQLVKSAVEAAKDDGARVINVRVAGPNAGHTVYDALGNKYAFRAIPVGAVIDEMVDLYIAPGSEVDLEVLGDEVLLCREHGWDLSGRLFISRQATVLEQRHKDDEAREGLVSKVGSTGKGIGAARADRIMRTAKTMGQLFEGEADMGWTWAEPEDLYATDKIVHEGNQYVLIEGTQGYGLSLRASGHYPQVTSSDARSVDFLAMAGIDPTRCKVEIQNWVVARVFPIRVAGNSGPMEGETSWEELGLEQERTTVTQKVRRVGAWDEELVKRAVQANGGHQAKVVITMLDQIIPELADIDMSKEVADFSEEELDILQKAHDWCEEHASKEQIGAEVAAITFGPTKILWATKPDSPLDAFARQMAEGLGLAFGSEVRTVEEEN